MCGYRVLWGSKASPLLSGRTCDAGDRESDTRAEEGGDLILGLWVPNQMMLGTVVSEGLALDAGEVLSHVSPELRRGPGSDGRIDAPRRGDRRALRWVVIAGTSVNWPR